MSKCTFDSRLYLGMAVGMFHCPECGQMLLAGYDHPDYDKLNELIEEEDNINAV